MKKVLVSAFSMVCVCACMAQDRCVPPDPLVLPDGTRIGNVAQWEETGRPAWLQMFREQMHGYFPDVEVKTRFEVQDIKKDALQGSATRKMVRAHFTANGLERHADMVMYIPNKQPLKGSFVGLNFLGNYACFDDPDIPASDQITGTQRTRSMKVDSLENYRGMQARRWPVQEIVDAGYALVTACYNDFYRDTYPDQFLGYKGSVAEMMFAGEKVNVPDSSRAQAVATWAWGLGRMLDYVYSDADFTTKNAAVIGHSRLGKTSIWAGVTDPRFGLVISNNSGSCGAAVARCKTGESLARTNSVRPQWFCLYLHRYMDNEFAMPFDMNVLLSLVAPRAVYVAGASQDKGAAPEFEYKGLYYASPVYKLYGFETPQSTVMPAVGQDIHLPRMGFHLREGKHDIVLYDWERYLKYADVVFGK